MLGKLIKYEFKETYKFFLIMYGLVILFCFLSGLGLSQLFGTEMKELLLVLFVLVFLFTNGISRTITYVMILRRYYVNMLKDQAYLTHTLPVKMSQRLVAMLVVDIIWVMVSGIVLLCSAVGLTLNTDMLGIAVRTVVQIIQFMAGEPFIILFAIMAIVILSPQEVLSLLCFFAGISLGQTIKGHLLIGSIIFCYVLNYAKNLVVNIIIQLVPHSFLNVLADIETKADFLSVLRDGRIFLIGGGVLFVTVAMAGVFFYLAHYMMTSKLELE